MRHLVRPAAMVANFFDSLPQGQVATVMALHQAVLEGAPGVDQAVRWGNLMFLVRGNHMTTLVPHKGQAHLQFFQGFLLAERFPQLEGVGKGMRILKFRYSQPVDTDLVMRIAAAAMELRLSV
ncbi:DUF1801 domain-containing protein [Sphaerotilus sp.]|uniref:DUF1801 domain-containing protein n=1 Tax=Sphaerotilus sp. TaxID=2093942 RepID=UPI00286E618E|nr:DUF1801 domain-containing protein [Sphaerotilus sp.]